MISVYVQYFRYLGYQSVFIVAHDVSKKFKDLIHSRVLLLLHRWWILNKHILICKLDYESRNIHQCFIIQFSAKFGFVKVNKPLCKPSPQSTFLPSHIYWLKASSLIRGLSTLWLHSDAQCVIWWHTVRHLWCTMTHSVTLANLKLWQIFKVQKYDLEIFFCNFIIWMMHNDALCIIMHPLWRTVHH